MSVQCKHFVRASELAIIATAGQVRREPLLLARALMLHAPKLVRLHMMEWVVLIASLI